VGDTPRLDGWGSAAREGDDAFVWSCCASFSERPDRVALNELATTVNWQIVRATAIRNGVLGWVAAQASALAVTPRTVRLQLLADLSTIRARVERTVDIFEQALPLILRHHDIIILRGMAYAYTRRGERPLRDIGDIDVLIEQPTCPSVSGWLRDHHHVPADVSLRWPRTFEYHHDLNACWGPRIARIDMREFWRRRRRLEVAGHAVGVLAPEDDFLFLCFHNVIKGFVKLYRFLDLLQVIAHHDMQWDAIVERAARYRISRAVWMNCCVANLLRPGAVPPHVVKACRPPAWIARPLLRHITPAALLHDPNPAGDDPVRSRGRQLRKALFVRALLLHRQNAHALGACWAAHRAHLAYRWLTAIPVHRSLR
jgi:hypothetical protein